MRRLFSMIFLVFALLGLTACGIKPDDVKPSPDAAPNAYPRTYPDPRTDPQP